eukprot:5513802-Lingulodinium_polyedra.AAC.1
MLTNVKALLPELTSAHAVMLEAPPIVTSRFELDMLELVQRSRTVGPKVAIIVQLSRRRRTKTPLWAA